MSSHGSECEELQSSQSILIGGGGQNPEQPGMGGQLQHLLEEILGRLGPRRDEEQRLDRERERCPRRGENIAEQEAVVAGHMRDLLRARPPSFDGSGGGSRGRDLVDRFG